jgi:protein gp37
VSDRSAIEWTDASWNPIRARNLKTGKIGWHCEHATTGCEFCYSEGFNKRLGTGLPFKPGHRSDIELFLDDKMLTLPLRWRRPRKIFVCSMTDLFADFVADEWIDKMFAVMALCPQHTFQVLTKRAERMRDYFSSDSRHASFSRADAVELAMDEAAPAHWCARELADVGGWPLKNVWLGVSCERQQEYEERWPFLRTTPAAIRFISYEPALGPLNFSPFPHPLCVPGPLYPDWLICGGESGHNARPMNPQWARDIRDLCIAAGVSYFFKQWGEFAPVPLPDTHPRLEQTMGFGNRRYRFRQFMDIAMVQFGKERAGRKLDGREWNEFPDQVRA